MIISITSNGLGIKVSRATNLYANTSRARNIVIQLPPLLYIRKWPAALAHIDEVALAPSTYIRSAFARADTTEGILVELWRLWAIGLLGIKTANPT